MPSQYLPANTWVQPERFVLPAFASNAVSAHIQPDALNFLRERVFCRLGLDRPPQRRHCIYISREFAPKRRLLNEAEIQQVLEPYGFETYYLERMTFAQQVRLFYDADAIVAPYGAGLTNAIFAPAGIPLTVLIATEYTLMWYFFLALGCGLDYHYILPREPLGKESRHADFMIHPADLRRALPAILKPQRVPYQEPSYVRQAS